MCLPGLYSQFSLKYPDVHSTGSAPEEGPAAAPTLILIHLEKKTKNGKILALKKSLVC